MYLKAKISAAIDRNRRWRLVTSMVVAIAVLLVPSVLVGLSQQPQWLSALQIIVAGLVLSAGRQGVDLILLRSLGVAWALPVGWYAGGVHPNCSSQVDCKVLYIDGIAAAWTLFAFVLFVVAVAANLALTRKRAALAPELAWLQPKRPWQRVLMVIGGTVLAATFYLTLGWPAY
jgi:hypothetical protein